MPHTAGSEQTFRQDGSKNAPTILRRLCDAMLGTARRRQRSRLLILVGLPIWVLTSALLLLLAQSYVRELEAHARDVGFERLEVATSTAEQSFLRITDAAESLLRLLGARQHLLAEGQAEAAQAITAELSMLHQVGLHTVLNASVLDAQGVIRWSSRPGWDMVFRGDREYFQGPLFGDGGLYVSAPRIGDTSGRRNFHLSRRIVSTDGRIHGVTRVAIGVEDLSRDLSALRLGRTGAVMLLRGDGVILAHSQSQAPFSVPESVAAEAQLLQAIQSGGHGSIVCTDGRPKLAVFQQIGSTQVFAVASVDMETEMRGMIFGRRAAMAATGLLAALLFGAIVALVFWQERSHTLARLEHAQRQREAVLAHLRNTNRDLEHRVAEHAAALAASEADFRAMFESTAVGMALAIPKSGNGYLRSNARLCAMTGYSAAELRNTVTALDITHPDDREAWRVDFDHQMATTRSYSGERRILRKDGRVIWVRADSVQISGGPAGETRAVSVIQDITARKQVEEKQALLAREVDHRAKNLLSVVQAAIRMTPRHDADAYATILEGRVNALARVHSLLADSGWTGTTMRAAANTAMAPFTPAPLDGALATVDQPSLTLAGPDLVLKPTAVQGLSLVLHELATNATKYGALSAPHGRLTLHWMLNTRQRELRLTWRESGAPPIEEQPQARGFGTRVIDSTIRGQLGGMVERHWHRHGLTCILTLPMERTIAMAMETTPSSRPPAAGPVPQHAT